MIDVHSPVPRKHLDLIGLVLAFHHFDLFGAPFFRGFAKLGGDGIGWTAGTQTQWWMNMTIDDERPFTDDMKRIVAEQKLAFVATVCPDGTPNLSPKGTIAV